MTITGAAATAFPAATDAAAATLRAGGNAIDAAVAAAWALAVCEPSGSGLGGHATILIAHADGHCTVLDGHSRAPAAVTAARVSRLGQRVGHAACTVPSAPATYAAAQAKWGVLSAADVLTPAIRLAEEGYAVTPLQHRQARWALAVLRRSPSAAALFLTDGAPPPVGSTFRQPALARTLTRLARVGVEDFYHGQIAATIAADMAEHGGLLTARDLATLSAPVERDPLTLTYSGHRVVTVPPPGGGLQLLMGLQVLAALGAHRQGDDGWAEDVADTTRAVFRIRNRSGLHPDDFTAELLDRLLDEDQAAKVARRIRMLRQRHRDDPPVGALLDGKRLIEEPGDTTHLCLADAEGNVVSLTASVQSLFGAKVATPDLGFLYNNYLTTCPRRQHPSMLAPGALPQSNVTPTIVFGSDDTPTMALGAAGSRRITSSLLQVITGVLDRGRDLERSVSAPRVHGLLGRTAWVERPLLTDELSARLCRRYQRVHVLHRRHYAMGGVQALQLDAGSPNDAVADPRREGSGVVLVDGTEKGSIR